MKQDNNLSLRNFNISASSASFQRLQRSDLKDILAEVIKIIKKAGKTVLFYYRKDYKIEHKAPDSPITQADIESNKVILKGLEKFNYGILSEETTDDKSRLKKERVWIIDPMDGTRDFIDKTGEFTIMIGLVEKGRPILGVVYKPDNDILYYGIKNQGAYVKRSGNRPVKLKVSSVFDWPETRMTASRFHRSEAEMDLAKKLDFKEVITCGSAGLKIGLIAQGKAELNVNPSNKTYEWDICAADIILSEAGGKLTDTRGREFIYNKNNPRNEFGYMASNGVAHDLIVNEF